MPDDRFIHKRAGHGDKPNSLTSDEFRVWIQYTLSADDFGVMRADAVQFQADNDWLRRQSGAKVTRWLKTVIASGLIDTFIHQGSVYLFQRDWQTWQKVGYPRQTNHPAPSTESIQKCDEATRKLFLMHPGGNSRKFKKDSENFPETFQEDSAPTRAGAGAKRLTANGQRLEANGERPTAGGERRTRPAGVSAGTNPRDHLRHAWCGATWRVCVPETLHGDLMRKLGGEDVAARITAFYAEVEANLDPAEPVPSDVFKFWKAHFDARFATAAPKPQIDRMAFLKRTQGAA